jgi:hypothetical protein
MTQKSTYLPNPVYHTLLDDLLAIGGSFDPRSRLVEILGCAAGIWPETVRSDAKRNQAKS